MLLRLLLCTSILGLLAGCASSGSSKEADLVFAEFRFQVPHAPSAIGVQEGELFTALRYGSEPGKNYLTFANRPRYPAAGCPAQEFFDRISEPEGPVSSSSCDPDQLRDFTELLAESALEHGLWKSSTNLAAFYLTQEHQTMVFLMGSGGAFVKIDTDFMSLAALKAMVMGASQQ